MPSMLPPTPREVEMAQFNTCCSLSATAGALAKLWDRTSEDIACLPWWQFIRRREMRGHLLLLLDLHDVIAEEEQVQGR